VTLRERDSVIVQAYHDARGNLIAQTIRLRKR
jgi:YD repeat-containing protein